MNVIFSSKGDGGLRHRRAEETLRNHHKLPQKGKEVSSVDKNRWSGHGAHCPVQRCVCSRGPHVVAKDVCVREESEAMFPTPPYTLQIITVLSCEKLWRDLSMVCITFPDWA